MPARLPQAGRKLPCEKCPLRTFGALRDFTPEELAFVSQFKTGELNAEAGTTLLMQGTSSAHLYTVLSGWAFRYKTLPDGRRQILNFALPSDFLGLQGSVMQEMQHSVEALTDMVLCVFNRAGCGISTRSTLRWASTSPGSPLARSRFSTSTS